MSAIEQNKDGIRLRIFLQPKASKDHIAGIHDDELKITITAPPVDGQANAHLLKFLSKSFKVPKSSIILEKGELSRNKQVWIPDPKLISKKIIVKTKKKITALWTLTLSIYAVLRYSIPHFLLSKCCKSAVKI